MLTNIVIIGASGTIGHAFTKQFAAIYPNAMIHACSTKTIDINDNDNNIIPYSIDYESETSIEQCAGEIAAHGAIDRLIVATGMLHDAHISPEKSLNALSAEKFQHLFAVNTILPALIAKHFLPKLNKHEKSIFAILSARVGSISDNQLGGWYAYRASKAALNMIIKNAAIEIKRRNKYAIIVGLHPGTVDSPLSEPFKKNVPADKLFSADYSVSQLLAVLDKITPEDSGLCFAWDGQEIKP